MKYISSHSHVPPRSWEVALHPPPARFSRRSGVLGTPRSRDRVGAEASGRRARRPLSPSNPPWIPHTQKQGALRTQTRRGTDEGSWSLHEEPSHSCQITTPLLSGGGGARPPGLPDKSNSNAPR